MHITPIIIIAGTLAARVGWRVLRTARRSES
jgi:hypothetical protein